MPLYIGKNPHVDKIIIACDCCAECKEIHLQIDDEDGFECVYVSLRNRMGSGFWYRLKYAWKVLVNGMWDNDEMILDISTIDELKTFLVDNEKLTTLVKNYHAQNLNEGE